MMNAIVNGTIIAVVRKCDVPGVGWVSKMDEMVNRLYMVSIADSKAVHLKGVIWSVPFESIEIVKPGMRVKAIGDSISNCGITGKIGTVIDRSVCEEDCIHVQFDNVTGWNTMHIKNVVFVPEKEKVERKGNRNAKVRTRKVLVKIDDGSYTKCREITGFENIIERNDLPEEYFKGMSFENGSSILIYKRVFSADGRYHAEYQSDEQKKEHISFNFNVDNFPYSTLKVGDVVPEEIFQNIMEKFRECGTRLMEIKKAEKVKKEWSGEEVVEI